MDVREAQDAIREVTDGMMLDVVYDITGHPVVLPAAVQLVRKLGKVILLGDCPTPSQQHLGPNVVSSSVAILGIHGSMMPDQPSPFNPWTEHEMTQLFFDYLLQERMSVSDLITRRYSPADAPAAYERLTQSRSEELGVILDWDRL
jgi:threonine dehydrogenase-like Zn-dependent dehydrogenase